MPDSGPDATKQDLAEKRTAWALRRTLLAKERTFAAWLRTGLTSYGGGLAVARLLSNQGPRWLIVAVAASLVVLGGACALLGVASYQLAIQDTAGQETRALPSWTLWGLSAVFGLTALAGLALVLT